MNFFKVPWLHKTIANRRGRVLRRRARKLYGLWAGKGDPLMQFRILIDVSAAPIGKTVNRYLYGINTGQEIDDRTRHIVLKYAMGLELWTIPLEAIDRSVPVSVILPPSWRARLRFNGVRVASVRSSLAWQIRQIRYLMHALHVTWVMTRFSWSHASAGPRQPYWIAHAFPKNSYPSDTFRNVDCQLVPFILDALGDDGPTGIIWAVQAGSILNRPAAGIVAAPEVLPPLQSRLATAGFAIAAVTAVGLSMVRWLVGRAEAPALAKEAVELKYLRKLPSDRLPNWYITTNSGCGAHPLWIREAEARGVKCAMIFYSISNQVLQFNDDPRPTTWSPEHRLLNWSRYLVRDQYQANWIRTVASGNPEIIQIGNIPLEDNGQDLPALPTNSIAVFDITPLREAFFASYGDRIGVLTDEFITSFLMEVFHALRDAGLTMVLKLKRERPSRLVGKRYRRCVEFLRSQPNVISIDPGIAAKRVAAQTMATISLPFSSTGPTAGSLGKRSVYYDPSGKLMIDHDENHGIPVLKGRAALDVWLASLSAPQERPDARQDNNMKESIR